MADSLSIAAKVLSAWGASVHALPTSHKEECDWLAELDGCRLIVEEKLKLDDPSRIAVRDAALATGQIAASTQPLTTNNRISAIVRKASGQLASTGGQVQHDFQILWFTGVGFEGEAKCLQLVATLYGSTRLFQLSDPQMRTCYFFRNADFYRYRDQLDGAVAAHLSGSTVTLKLCLNPHSPRWEALRDSPLAKNFKQGLVDPIAEERAGHAYIVDSDIDRRDSAALVGFLEKKYNLERVTTMDMGMASAAISLGR